MISFTMCVIGFYLVWEAVSYAAPAKVRENWGPKTRVGGGLLGWVAATI